MLSWQSAFTRHSAFGGSRPSALLRTNAQAVPRRFREVDVVVVCSFLDVHQRQSTVGIGDVDNLIEPRDRVFREVSKSLPACLCYPFLNIWLEGRCVGPCVSDGVEPDAFLRVLHGEAPRVSTNSFGRTGDDHRLAFHLHLSSATPYRSRLSCLCYYRGNGVAVAKSLKTRSPVAPVDSYMSAIGVGGSTGIARRVSKTPVGEIRSNMPEQSVNVQLPCT